MTKQKKEKSDKKQDKHRTVASEMLGVQNNEVTEEQRRIAKAINFGIMYGRSFKR